MRLMLKRPLTDTWLDLEAPVYSISVTEVLNGPADITVELPISYLNALGSDQARMVSEYATLLIVEDDAEDLYVALVDDIETQEDTITVSGAGLSVMAKGTPWLLSKKSFVDADPVNIFKEVWAHILSFPESKVGLRITGDSKSSGTLGTASSSEFRAVTNEARAKKAALDVAENRVLSAERGLTIARQELFKVSGSYAVGQVIVSDTAPVVTTNTLWIKSNSGNRMFAYRKGKWFESLNVATQVNSYLAAEKFRDDQKTARDNAQQAYRPYEERLNELRDQEGEPYDLAWWANHDLSQVIEELTSAGPFEYVEKSRWSGDDLDLTIQVGAPRIGVRRHDLRFEFGVNVTQYPRFTKDDPYTHLLLLGAGEGSTTLKAQRQWRDKTRVRRVSVKTDKDARTKEQVLLAAKREADKVGPGERLNFDTLVVSNHPWALPSQYEVGDEIHVSGELLDGSDFSSWIRIVEKTFNSESTDIVLKVEVV